MIKVLSLIFIISLSNTNLAFAESSAKGDFIGAKNLKKKAPKYPKNAAQKKQEGWVILSFVIDRNGDVINPAVEKSSGFAAFDNSAIRAVKNWKYQPATQNGKAIQQSKWGVKFDFTFNHSLNITEDFYMNYRELIRAIKKGDLEGAEKLLKEIENNKIWNHTESSFYWLADSIYAKAVDDIHRELQGVNRALATNNEKLKNENLLYLRNRQFVLNVTVGYFRKALTSYRLLKKLPNSESLVKDFSPYYEQLKVGIKEEKLLIREGEISQTATLWHLLSRNNFSLNIMNGAISELDIRCDAKYQRYKFVKDMKWNIEQGWGKCFLRIKGKPNSKIEIIESGKYIKQ